MLKDLLAVHTCDDFRKRLFGSWKDNCRYHLLKKWSWLGSRSVRDTLVTSEGSRGETRSRIQSRWMLATRLHRAKFCSFLAAFCSILCPLQFLNCRRAKSSTSMLFDMFTTFRIRECGQSTGADDNRKKETTPFCDSEEKNEIGKTATTTDCTFL